MTVNPDSLTIKNNEAAHRFEATLPGYVAFLDYTLSGECVVFTHTEVPEELDGQGIGSKLVEAALQDAHARRLTVIPLCPFVTSYIQLHPQYIEIVDPEYRELCRAGRS